MSRRTPGSLVALEREILDAALSLRRSGDGSFHGFGIARQLRERSRSRSLTAHGTLYKALARLEDFGLLRSRWDVQPTGGRPRRRLYELTAEGAQVAEQTAAGRAAGAADTRNGDSPAPHVAPEPA